MSVVQPLIQPLHQGRTLISVLSILSEVPDSDTPYLSQNDRESVRKTIQEITGGETTGPESDAAWRKVLHDGFVAGTAAKPKDAPSLNRSH